MGSGKGVKFGAAAGFFVSSASAVFIQLNQQWLGDHPHIVGGLYGVALILAALSTLHTEWVKRLLGNTSATASAGSSAPNVVKASANGNIQKLEQHFHGTLQSTAPVPTFPSTEPPARPKFHWNFRYARVTGANGIWRESQSLVGYQSLVLDVSAMPPEAGTERPPLHSLRRDTNVWHRPCKAALSESTMLDRRAS